MKEKLFTIGEVAKITGTHAKSLRYYEEIDILQPAYIDPDSRYRYYSQQQLDLVALIQLCIELDIPLKSLKQFSCANNQQIDVQQVFAYGKMIAKEKIAKLQRGLNYIESFEADVQQNQTLMKQKGSHVGQQLQEKFYYTKQIRQLPTISGYWKTYQEMSVELGENGLEKRYEDGMMIYRDAEGDLSYYQFIEITPIGYELPPQVVMIQAGNYRVEIIDDVVLTGEMNEVFLQSIPKMSWIVATDFVLGTFQVNVFQFKVRLMAQTAVHNLV